MATLLQRLTHRRGREEKAWAGEPKFWDINTSLLWNSGLADRENLIHDFESYVEHGYRSNGIVFACMLVRQLVLSEARFLWREYKDGRPGDLYGNQELGILERPWPGGLTGEMLARMESDASIAGNSYQTTVDDSGTYGRASVGGAGRRIVRLRPDWVTILMGSNSGNPNAVDARTIAYIYDPPNPMGAKDEPVILLPDEVAHYSPIPDPTAHYRGMSWMTPIVREIQGDSAATAHKLAFFENGASPKLVASLSPDIPVEEFREFIQVFKEQHQGVGNAYKTLFLGGGADVTVAGADLKQLDFKATQGAGETRIAAAAAVPPSIVGLSEGLAGSALNAGNYMATRRRFADGTCRPLWRMMAGSLESITPPPAPNISLWYDDRDIAFLREDEKDNADIQSVKAQTIRQYVDAGFEPLSVIAAINANDLKLLVHSGLYSVQLQPPGTTQANVEPGGTGRGN